MWKRDEAVRPTGGQPAASPPSPAPNLAASPGHRSEAGHSMEKDIVNIGKSVVIKGELNGSEDLTIEGHVEGTIQLREHVLRQSAGELAVHAGDRVGQGHRSERVAVVTAPQRQQSRALGVPQRAPARAAWRLYTAAGLPLLGRVASREWAWVGRFLGPSIRGFYERYPEPRLLELWWDAGIRDLHARRLSLGGGIVIWGRRA